jgi:hypothetical protein
MLRAPFAVTQVSSAVRVKASTKPSSSSPRSVSAAARAAARSAAGAGLKVSEVFMVKAASTTAAPSNPSF